MELECKSRESVGPSSARWLRVVFFSFFFLEGIRRSYQRIPDLSQLSFTCKLDKTGPDRFGAFKTGFTAT